jgi:hypothetical protein
MQTETEVIAQHHSDAYAMYNGDTFELIQNIPDDSIGFCIYSPPFNSLYQFSDSDRDMGNCESYEQFFEQYAYLIRDIHRTLKPGRCTSVHCMNLPTSMQREGVIGLRDFRGDIIREHVGNEHAEFYVAMRRLKHRKILAEAEDDFQRALKLENSIETMEDELRKYPGDRGFIYHSEVCVWKCPVVAVTRSKALGLLHKQLVKDSSRSRQGIPDFVCTFRKVGDNPDPIQGELDHFAGNGFVQTGNLSIDIWQKYASPVWMDIDQSRTLNGRPGKDENDVKHICPLQLDVIHRCLQLWSKEGDTVLSPFAGIGSEGYESLKMKRKFIGMELKQSYYDQAIKNLDAAQSQAAEPSLFDAEMATQ